MATEPTNFFAAGGIVAYPLLVFSILTVALSVERIIFWFRVYSIQPKVIRRVLIDYQENPGQVMKTLTSHRDLPVCRIFTRALGFSYNHEHLSPTQMHTILESAAQAELPILRRFSTVFTTVIAVSPLLGLLGTVLGLMRAFSSLSLGNFDGTQVAGVTGGVSEALVSTVMGLVVAIVALLFANLFRSFYRRQLAFIQESLGQLEVLYSERLTPGELHHV
ncbi:MotA/TolQ/ExbB proton channel family protein [Thermosynechococcaceae cyanobacterium BACA0444]|uniref:MotA/TolQ/ExbB proton channel family protein n=1 Tax=Pseudocalidococcus azoricus BACA0444 TaxID=2918990 RepID=A0AAE4FWJ8_9CYAN|nr:MotA/TolQ/ExbB proton channel family protein [Pseudocalidococcus azoricus]MDS3862285.1 MotA/TolQ/ExbB proton channel family protein [Pseudocalidococcus azoricus BACA0444]